MKKTPSKTHRTKPNGDAWFVAVRGSYLPCSWQGWSTYVPFVAYLVFSLIASWQETGTIGRTLLLVVPNWVAAVAVLTWVAKRNS